MSRVDPGTVRWLVDELHRLQRVQSRNTGKPQLAFSSIEDGAISGFDREGTQTVELGRQHDGTHTSSSLTGPKPPIPWFPSASAVPGVVEVRWNGKFAGGAVSPMDFKHVAAYAVPVGTVVNLSDQSGVMTGELGDSVQVQAGAGVYDVYLAAWTLSGKVSDLAGPVSVVVPVPADGDALQQAIDDAQAAVDAAAAELAAAKLELDGRLDTAESDLSDHDDRLATDEGRIDAAFGQIAEIETVQGRQVTYGSSPPTGMVPGKSLWVTPSGHTYISQECNA